MTHFHLNSILIQFICVYLRPIQCFTGLRRQNSTVAALRPLTSSNFRPCPSFGGFRGRKILVRTKRGYSENCTKLQQFFRRTSRQGQVPGARAHGAEGKGVPVSWFWVPDPCSLIFWKNGSGSDRVQSFFDGLTLDGKIQCKSMFGSV